MTTLTWKFLVIVQAFVASGIAVYVMALLFFSLWVNVALLLQVCCHKLVFMTINSELHTDFKKLLNHTSLSSGCESVAELCDMSLVYGSSIFSTSRDY